MNIEIANKLLQLRREKGLSQEALAQELGISRQAVSKWERAEASPDTDNLIELAKLYGISLDELLLHEPTTKEEKKNLKKIKSLKNMYILERMEYMLKKMMAMKFMFHGKVFMFMKKVEIKLILMKMVFILMVKNVKRKIGMILNMNIVMSFLLEQLFF